MNPRTTLALRTAAVILCLAVALPSAFAQQNQHGTAADAKAMLQKAITEVKTNKDQAIEMFNAGTGGFLDRDIFPFCFNLSDGKVLATQLKQLMGRDVRTIVDGSGKPFGKEFYAAAQKPEGEITGVGYMAQRPGADQTPVEKVSFITRVGDLGCGVGYYK